jgi:cytochrome c-type biogenesis protein CcmH/NrfF
VSRVAAAALGAILALSASTASAAEAPPVADDAALEVRVKQLGSSLRCLVCQNQSIADSHAALALDLQQQIREQLRAGRSEADVIGYMTDRYGDFVLYKPPLKGATMLLWVGPAVLLLCGTLVLVVQLRRHQRAGNEPGSAGIQPPSL